MCLDKNVGIVWLEEVIVDICISIEVVGGYLVVKMEFKVVIELDDVEFQVFMEKRECENVEVSGDELVSEFDDNIFEMV